MLRKEQGWTPLKTVRPEGEDAIEKSTLLDDSMVSNTRERVKGNAEAKENHKAG